MRLAGQYCAIHDPSKLSYGEVSSWSCGGADRPSTFATDVAKTFGVHLTGVKSSQLIRNRRDIAAAKAITPKALR